LISVLTLILSSLQFDNYYNSGWISIRKNRAVPVLWMGDHQD
jgi:hypothetical protein